MPFTETLHIHNDANVQLTDVLKYIAMHLMTSSPLLWLIRSFYFLQNQHDKQMAF